MKTLTLIALFPLFASANYSVGEIKSVKLMDGKALYCDSDRSVSKRGYLPADVKISAKDGALDTTFNVNAVICTKMNGVFQFAPIGINEPISAKDIYGNPIVKHIVSNDAVLVSDSYKIIAKYEMKNLKTQAVSANNIELSALLSEIQMQALNKGDLVNARIQYFQQFGIVVETKEKNIPVGKVAGGGFAFTFQLVKNSSGELEVSNIRVE